MPYCDRNSAVWKVVLLQLSIAVGVLACFLSLLIFLYYWFQAPSDSRSKPIPRICLALQIVCLLERTVRSVEVPLWFHGSRLEVDILYNLNTLSFVLMYGLMMGLLTFKLVITFAHSIYEPPSRDIRVIVAMIAVDLTLKTVFAVCNGIPALYLSLVGRILMFSLIFLGVLLSITVLGILDYSFSWRLTSLVASSSVSNPAIQTPQSPRSDPGSPKSSSMKQNEELMENDLDEEDKGGWWVRRQTTLSEIRQANFENFDRSSQKVINTAVKSSLMALLITVSFLVFTVASVLFVFHDCADYGTIIGNLLISVSSGIVCMVAFFSLPFSQQHYRWLCSQVHSALQTLVVFLTTQKVAEIRDRTQQSGVTSI